MKRKEDDEDGRRRRRRTNEEGIRKRLIDKIRKSTGRAGKTGERELKEVTCKLREKEN